MLEASHQIIRIAHENHIAMALSAVASVRPKNRNSSAGKRWRAAAKSPILAPIVHGYDPVFEEARPQPFTDQGPRCIHEAVGLT